MSGGMWSSRSMLDSDGYGGGQGRGPGGGGGWGEDPEETQWGNNNSGAYLFGMPGTRNNMRPPYPTCHDTATGNWQDQLWNNVTPW